MSSIEILGLIAGFFSTFALVPQIMRVYRLKSAREISVLFTSALLTGIIIWLVYGIALGLIPIIIWNSIGLFLNGWLLITKLKYGKSSSQLS